MEAKKTVVAEKVFPQNPKAEMPATFSYRAMAKAAFGISFHRLKLFGFGRVAFAAVFGAGAQMDAYLVAS